MTGRRRGGPMAASCRTLLLVAGLSVLAAACRVDTAVEVDIHDDGSGVVTVVFAADADAVARVPELAEGLRLDDVRDAGWAVDGPISRGDGGVEVRAVKEFASSSQLPVVLAEIAGEGVIFSEVVLEQTRSFAESSYAFRAVVDPAPPVEAFSDGALAAIFGGQPFGRPLEDLIAEAGRPQDSLGMRFSLTLLDSDDAFSALSASPQADLAPRTPEIEGSTAIWRFSYGDPRAEVSASTTVRDTLAPLWLNIARAAALGFGLVALGVAVAWVVALVRTPKGRGRRATRRRQQRAAAREAEASRPRKRLLRLLVVDVHGVIVRPTEPLEGLLLPVILGENPDVDPDLVRDRHRKLVVGRLTAEEFWSDLGLGPIWRDVETRYLSSFRLVPGPAPVPRPDRGPGPAGRGRRQPVPGVGYAPAAHGSARGLGVVLAGERRGGRRAARAASVRGDPPRDVGGPLRLPVPVEHPGVLGRRFRHGDGHWLLRGQPRRCAGDRAHADTGLRRHPERPLHRPLTVAAGSDEAGRSWLGGVGLLTGVRWAASRRACPADNALPRPVSSCGAVSSAR